MIELVLGLVPDYGLYVVFVVVTLACLAVPLPASVLVLAAGGFAAAGDLVFWQVFLAAASAFLIGDQLAFGLARLAGSRLVARLRGHRRLGPIIGRSEDLLRQRGHLAVVISHTIASPTCPYVSYLCGAGGMPHLAFSFYSFLGVIVWTATYVGLGYFFSNQLEQVSSILSNVFGLFIALGAVAGIGAWLWRQWKDHADDARTQVAP